jgi:hypothetical protein
MRILTAVKARWDKRVTTVFVRQGHYATEAEALRTFPAADLSIEHIGDLLSIDRDSILIASDRS